MKPWRHRFLTTRRSRRFAGVTAGTLASVTLAAAAIAYPGFKSTEVDLNDGGVWVVSNVKNAVGRLNYASKVLDGAVTPTANSFDVRQSAGDVLVADNSGAAITPVNPATVRLGGEEKLPPSAQSSVGGGTVVIADPAKGRVWAIKAESFSGFTADSMEPTLKGESGITATVSPSGDVVAADPKAGKTFSFRLEDSGDVGPIKTRQVDELKGAGEIQLAAVGAEPVVLDAARGKLILPSGAARSVPNAKEARLQASGSESDRVAIATPEALLLQPLSGAEPRSVAPKSKGIPAAPVQVGECSYAAFSGSNQYLRECRDPSQNESRDIPKASSSPSFVFRVNRDLVVLNDVNAGQVWMVNQNMLLVNNWDDVVPPKNTADDAQEDSADEVQQTTLPDRSKPNTPPVVKPDSYGVRAGKTTMLSVLDNDSDADGDVLRVRADNQPGIGKVESIYGGTGFQINVPATAKGAGSFDYTADDGRGGSASSQVSLEVIPDSVNRKPELKPGRSTTLVVQQSKRLVQNILADWMDPDGDDVVLVSASSDNPQDEVRTRPDGQLTFADLGAQLGKRRITVTVSDGREQAEAVLRLDVRPPGAIAPIANADNVIATVGQRLVVAPLKNDIDPLGGQLRLAQVKPIGHGTATISADQQTFAFSSDAQGPHYVEYMVTNGPAATTQLVRVDVMPANASGAPIAVRDVAQLPSGGSTLVDVLGNDYDPSGGVLVVQSVTVPPGAPVSVSVLDHSVVRISDLRAQGTITLKYTISNGKASASGEISVVVIPPRGKLRAPETKADEATVRVGDVVTIPVLANDVDPDGSKLSLDPKLVQVPDENDGQTFVSGDKVRFLAGDKPGTVYAIYKAVNESGQANSEQIVIHIVGRDDAKNSRPEPKNVTARVLAGMQIKIPIPLDGIDPDGDSVELLGIDKAPALGTALIGQGFISYIASESGTGTDTFTYRVRDRLGAENTGTVIVGVAPAPTTNQKPIAVDDQAEVKPGRRIAVDALANDSDPDGDPISLLKDGFETDGSIEASATENGKVLIQAPDQATSKNIRYTIADDKKAQASAVIVLKVNPNATPKAPIANDDYVTVPETLGKTAVDVPVLKNDADPDGVTEDLKISFPLANPNAALNDKGGVRVNLSESAQLIPYTVTDMDGLTATAIIHVPGLSGMPPVLKKHDVVEVKAGEAVQLKLSDWVAVRDGRSPRISVADRVRVLGANATDVVGSDGVSLRYAALNDFAGPGSITFEVTDGESVDDADALKSTLTILTKVIPPVNKPERKNHPPSFLGATLEVPVDESGTLDVGALASDKDPDDAAKLRFALVDAPQGKFRIALDGSTLKASAPATMTVGTQQVIGVTVTDGRSEPVRADFTIVAIASDKPKAVANDDSVDKANAGKAETVDVTANDVNPFPDTPLKVVDVAVEAGRALGSPSVNGGSITVTPAQDYQGVLVVRYSIQDKTGDPTRTATARLRLTVRAAPDAPGVPSATDVRDRTAVLKWTPPSDNGATITKYTVRASSGFTQECATTTCTLSGLTNNVPYRFTVVATNEVGDSKASAQSNEIRPDVKPHQPTAPTVKAGNENMAITWPAASSDGSPVKSYNLEISPPPANGVGSKTGITGTSFTWPGLSNGVEYRVRVQAVNDAPTPSEFSAFSVADHPAAPPAAPGAPSTRTLSAVGSENQIAVSWPEPATNGDPIRNYYVVMSGGSGGARQSVPGGTREAVFRVPNSEAAYTFTVQADNKAGKGPVSAPSAPRRATGKLGTPTGVRATAVNTGGNGGAIKVDFSPLSAAQRNGSSLQEVSYTFVASPSGQSGPISPGQTLSGFANGSQQVISVTARSSVAPSSDASAGAGATPYGAPGSATASGSNGALNSTNVTFSWSSPSTASNDVSQTQISVNGGAWERVAASGTRSVDTGGYSTSASLQARTLNSRGTPGPVARATATSGARKTEWATQLNGGPNLNRSCSYTFNGTNWLEGRKCDDASSGPPWLYPGNTFDVKCFATFENRYRKSSGGIGSLGMANWYFMINGPAAGRYVLAVHTPLGEPNGSEIPRC